MKSDVHAIRNMFRDIDPAKDIHVDPAEQDRNLNAILSSERTSVMSSEEQAPRRFARRGLLAAGVMAAVVAAVGVVGVLPQSDSGTPPSAALAVTPRLLTFTGAGTRTAREVLLELAAKTATIPSTRPAGPYVYVKSQGWHLSSAAANSVTASAVVPTLQEQWISLADRSGRIRSTVMSPQWPSAEAERRWHQNGLPAPTPKVSDERATGMHLTWMPRSLSADPRKLARQLQAEHPSNVGHAEILVAVADLYREQPVASPIRAAILTVLADVADLTYSGKTVDRVGRPGIAVSLDSAYGGLPSRKTLIFDPGSGALNAVEDMLTEDPGKLNVSIPSVISYTLFLRSGYTASVEQRP